MTTPNDEALIFDGLKWSESEVRSIRALRTGTASEAQQKEALDAIIRVAAGMFTQSYRPGDATKTAFNEGRRFVGIQLTRLFAQDVTAAINRQKNK